MKRTALFLSLLINAHAQAPTPQTEPSATVYDVGQLNLFPSYTRTTYKAATGKDAPAFDVTRAPKFWFDSTAGGHYQTISGFTLVPFTLTAAEASTVNLPPDVTPSMPAALTIVDDGIRYGGIAGLDVYLQNVVRTAELGPGGGTMAITAPINPATIAATVASGPFGTSPGIAGAAQALCAWLAGNNQMFRGGLDPACSAPAALIAKYTASIDAWAAVAAGVQVEMGLVPGTPCTYCAAIARPPVAMPVRALYPDERIQVGGMMGGVIVMRLAAPSQTAPSTGSGDGYGPADRAMLQDVQARLKQLMGQ